MPRDDYGFDVEEEEDTEEPEPVEDIYETGAPEREDIATETYETGVSPLPGPPEPLPRPPGIAPDIGRRSYMEALGRIEPPALEPLPQYPTGKPGFKGALMDALKGMIPGYRQGMESALKARTADVVMQNKSRMDLFREQMDIIRPMLQKDYETEAWLQKTQKMYEFLDRTYPGMTQHEKMAYSMGKMPRAPQRPRLGTTETAVLDDGSTLPVAYGDLGLIDLRTGKPIEPSLQARIKELRSQLAPPPKPQKPTRVRGLVIPPGLPGAGKPGVKIYHPDGTVTWEEEPIYQKPPAPPSPELQEIRALTIDRLRREAADIPGGVPVAPIPGAGVSPAVTPGAPVPAPKPAPVVLGPKMTTYATQRGDKFKTSEVAKKMSEVIEGWNFFATLDPSKPINQSAVIYALSKMWDPRTGVRQEEYETQARSLDSLWEQTKLKFENLVDQRGYFRPEIYREKILPAIKDRIYSYEDRYHESRNQEVKSLNQTIGRPGFSGGRFFGNYGENLSPFRSRRRNKVTGEEGEFFRRPNGELIRVEP